MVINYNILKRFEPMIGEHKSTKLGGATFLRMAQLLRHIPYMEHWVGIQATILRRGELPLLAEL